MSGAEKKVILTLNEEGKAIKIDVENITYTEDILFIINEAKYILLEKTLQK